ncbi:MAG: hypothetical protein B2I17_01750 [Thermoplasmatales archaeon B_DKE]|nr:MAG: hypothetical protein B2I17_03495 [Thermoplasmatales archaeon B_DKE]OWP57383.1 MAG: hypothetical protein B2I17_01750 [Thermoplasmatales archaeon B_DKE]
MRAVIFVKKSVRFPGKHSVQVNGYGMTEGIAKKLVESGLFEEVIIFSKDSGLKSDYGRIITDVSDGTILDSVILAVRKFGNIFAFAGDMPFICIPIVSRMLIEFKGKTLCPRSGDAVLQTLHCIYAGSDLKNLDTYATRGGKSLRDFVKEFAIAMDYGREDERCFENVNFRSDIERLKLS